MKNKKKLLLAAILILTIVSIGSYAIYKSTATGTSGFKTAKWYIELNDQDITTSNTFTFDLKAADWTHNAVIDSDETELIVIAPGSYGTFGIELDASETEVDVSYTLTARILRNNTEVELSTINPNLSLGFYENDTLKSNPLTGSIAAHGTYNGEIRIVWDAVDTSESNSQDININDQDFVIEVTVLTKQKEAFVQASELISSVEGLVNVGDALRYVGASVDNYVEFNGELWRIIGVYGDSLKIRKETKLSMNRKFASSDKTNEWDGSDIQEYLNGEYYENLSTEAQNMIANGTWYVGKGNEGIDASMMQYHSVLVTWTGKVGLITAAEYMYAATSDCYSTTAYSYQESCYNKDWVYLDNGEYSWTMTAYNSDDVGVLFIRNSGGLLSDSISVSKPIFPVVYLKSDVMISGGTGTHDNPYQLVM